MAKGLWSNFIHKNDKRVVASGTPGSLPYIRMAVLCAGFYLIVATLWIVISGDLTAALAAGSAEALYKLELRKGIGFVLVSSTALFLVLLAVFRELSRREQTIREQAEALMEAERSVTASVLSTSVAHDLNNLLSTAHLAMEEMREEGAAAEASDDLAGSLEAMNRLCEHLILAGKAELSRDHEDFRLRESVTPVVEMTRRHPTVRHASVVLEAFPDAWIRGSSALVCRALVNAILNAAEAGADQIHLGAVVGERGELIVTIEDNGPGIDALVLDRIFEPMFTTKPRGHGLGLSSMLACARYHEGEVSASASNKGGACFRLTIASGRVNPSTPD